MPNVYTVNDDYNEYRLDKWFKNKVINLPHSLIEKIIRQNKIKVNKRKPKSSYRLQTGDQIEIYDISKFKPTNNKKKIKYLPKKKEIGEYDDYIIEDNENFIVINKPSGIPVQSGTRWMAWARYALIPDPQAIPKIKISDDFLSDFSTRQCYALSSVVN